MNVGNDTLDAAEVIKYVEKLQGERILYSDNINEVLADEERSKADKDEEVKSINDAISDTDDELAIWESAADYLEQYAPDEILICEDHFVDYAMELAKDLMDINTNEWPCNCIDWDEAADVLMQDYTQLDIDGTTYYMRG